MFHKLSTRLLLVFAVALTSSVFAASAQKEQATPAPSDGSDGDTSILSLPILRDGEALEFTFENTDGAFLAAFNASEGDKVDISMVSSSSTLDPYIVVFGSAAELLAQDDDSGSEPLDSFIDGFEVPADGSYFILATSFVNRNSPAADDVEEQSFTLLVEGNTQPADIPEDSFSYFVVSAVIGETFDLDVDGVNPAYFVAFEGEAGQEISIETSGDGLDTLVMLFDYAGSRIGVDDDGGSAPLGSLVEAELPETGLYVAIITTYDYAFIASGMSEATEGTITVDISG